MQYQSFEAKNKEAGEEELRSPGSAGVTLGLDNFKGLFQSKWLSDSTLSQHMKAVTTQGFEITPKHSQTE